MSMCCLSQVYFVSNFLIFNVMTFHIIVHDMRNEITKELGTFNPPHGLYTRDEIQTRCWVNFMKQGDP